MPSVTSRTGSSIGVPVAPFAAVRSLADLEAAVARLGTPAVLKSADFGYDGKGQHKLRSPADVAAAWQAVGRGLPAGPDPPPRPPPPPGAALTP